MARLVWKIGDKPTGRHKAFHYRAWPIATLGRDGLILASMIPVSSRTDILRISYHPTIAETTPLIVRIADHRKDYWDWVQLKGRPVGITAAKELVTFFFKRNPDWWNAANAPG